MEIIFSATIIAISILIGCRVIASSLENWATELGNINKRLGNIIVNQTGTVNIKTSAGEPHSVIPGENYTD